MEIAQLKLALSQIPLAVSASQLSQLDAYAQRVYQTNQRFNLTAHDSLSLIYEKGIYDSLCFPLPILQQPKSLLDAGSGAGFPGIPLNILYPQLSITLLEPTLKKANFLTTTIEALSLKQIQVKSERAEVLVKQSSFVPIDLVVARAVASLPMLLELVIPLIKVGGHALIYKGKDYLAEMAMAKNALRVLGATIVEVKTHRLPTDHDQRALLVIEKITPTPPAYPRMFSQIKKTPL